MKTCLLNELIRSKEKRNNYKSGKKKKKKKKKKVNINLNWWINKQLY